MALVTFDGWNSESMIQRLQSEGIDAMDTSFSETVMHKSRYCPGSGSVLGECYWVAGGVASGGPSGEQYRELCNTL